MGRAQKLQALLRLMRNRYLPAAELRALQDEKLRAVTRHAYGNVPYYRSLFDSAGLGPSDVRSVDDLPRLPVTHKAQLRAAGLERITAQGTDLSSAVVDRTSGTSGHQFDVYHSRHEKATESLVRFRAHLATGMRPRDRLCHLGPHQYPQSALRQRLGIYRTEYVPTLLPIGEQIRRLRTMRPTILRAWPTALRAVLHQVEYRLSDIVQPRVLITSSEVLDQSLRKRILDDINVELFNFYVAAECGPIASECRAHEGLHVNADQLILEVLGEDGTPAAPGQPGVVVLTSLYGFVMPFIRYRLGDMCTLIDKPCSCGSTFPLISAPAGRHEDVVRLPSGTIRSALGLGLIVDEVDGIDQYRVVQERPDLLVVKLVLWQDLGPEVLAHFEDRLLEYLAEPVSIDVQIVDHIPDEGAKSRKFISRLPSDQVWESGAEAREDHGMA